MFCSRIIAAAAAQLQRPPTTVGDPVYSLIILPLLLLLMLLLMLMPLLPMAMEQPQGVQRRPLMSYC
jgi:cytochrome c biogenesis factor